MALLNAANRPEDQRWGAGSGRDALRLVGLNLAGLMRGRRCRRLLILLPWRPLLRELLAGLLASLLN